MLAIFLQSCTSSSGERSKTSIPLTEGDAVEQNVAIQAMQSFPKNVGDIPLPSGFNKSPQTSQQFGGYLSTLSLKEKGAPVKLYNGENKWNQNVHYAVVDMPIGSRDLHQCADAVMRVRADFLRQEKRFQDIAFHFVSGFNCEYSKWTAGNRVKVSGNNVTWYSGGTKGDTDESYWKYLETVWSYASTLSLEKELKPKNVADINAGDVWIKGGSPGHAILVIDVVKNEQGKKLFLLAQSYMPAQEMHILKNPEDTDLSPWYEIPTNRLTTPEWTFELNQLRQWP